MKPNNLIKPITMKLIPTITLSLLISCASTYHSGLDLNKFTSIPELPLDSIRLYKNDLPTNYSFSKDVFFPDMQTAILYNEPDIYHEIIGGVSIAKKASQSFVGPNGDQGSIFYIYFTGALYSQAKEFLSPLLWGSASPTSDHPEEFFVTKNTIIIWGFTPESPLKKVAQQKLNDFCIRSNSRGYVAIQSFIISSDSKTVEDFVSASRKFMSRDYKGSISFYENVLKKDSLVSRTYWYVLIDNLGMAYGITGDLESAEKVFRYGLSKDPTYPLFYYNLACTFAEKNDLDSSISFLKSAYKYEANLIRGETFPNPEVDDSFQRFMKNEKFVSTLNELKKK